MLHYQLFPGGSAPADSTLGDLALGDSLIGDCATGAASDHWSSAAASGSAAGTGEPAPYRVWTPKKILVPTVGTEYSKNAVELAAVLAASTKAEVTILHISRTGSNDVDSARPHEIGAEIVAREADRARKFGATVETHVIEGAQPEKAIVRLVEEGGFDLLVLGSSLRAVSQRAFFGHRIEHILKHAPCPTLLLSAG